MKNYRVLIWAASLFLLAAPGSLAQNIEIDTSSPFLYPEYSKKISMDFQEAPLDDVLKIFSQQAGFNLITSESVAARKVTVYLDKVPVEQALEQLLRANNLTYEVQPDSNIYMVKPLPQTDTELLTRVYPLKHATVSSAQIQKTIKIDDVDRTAEGGLSETIKALLTAKGKLVEDPRTNSLIITDIAANFPTIENALAKLDVPVPQILIEVEMLEVTKGTADLLGNKISSTLLTVTGAKKFELFPFKLPTGYEWEDGKYVVGSADFSTMTATLQFLRTLTDTKTLARPRILTLNNQAAEIRISTDEAVGTSSTVSGGGSDSLTTSSTSAERMETGVSLIVTPQANLVTGEITMAVMPKVIVAKTSSISTNANPIKDPEERSTKALLRVQSGDTVIIAGLVRQDVSKTITKIPFLGDIPFFGGAFRHRNESVTDRELLVFLTPHIINETPVPQTTVAVRKLDREQDLPGMDAVSKEKAETR